MISRVVVLLALLLLIYWGVNSLTRRYAMSGSQARWLLGLSIALTATVVLIVMGRLPVQFLLAPLGVAATFLLRTLPAMLRLVPLWQMLKDRTFTPGQAGTGRAKRKSVIRTEYLVMELLHSTGELDGQVTKGSFEGRQLSSLTLQELLRLARECRVDQDSLQLLEAYLDRKHPDWRARAQQEETASAAIEEPPMNKQLALEILGLGEQASLEDIQKAHRKLMQKMHPDRGGSEYLAKKINAARDYLEEHS